MPEASFDALLSRAGQIDGFLLGCVIDASTGTVLGSAREDGSEDLDLPVAAAGAADVANVISLMAAGIAANGGLEDVIITMSGHYHLIRRFSPAPKLQFLLLVVLDRTRANLAMALRELRDIDLSLAARPDAAVPGHHRSL
jgi:hypothetical protein